MEFFVEAVNHTSYLRPDHGIIRAPALRITADAEAAAQNILAAAEAEASEILARARKEGDAATQAVERETLDRAHVLLQCLEEQQRTFLKNAQSTVLDLALALFDRLAMDQSQRKRAGVLLKRLLAELPPRLHNAQLWIHPEDAALLPAVEWEIRADESMRRGTCRLEASNGDWCVDFPLAVETIKASFIAAANPGSPSPHARAG